MIDAFHYNNTSLNKPARWHKW